MLFNSIEFFLFLPIVFILYWSIGSKRIGLQNILLVIASYIFYGWWDWRFLALIILSSVVDYFVGIGLSRFENRRKLLLGISVSMNLGVLVFFKYFNFFLDSFVSTFVFFGKSIAADRLDVVLPVGISFYTFQTLSYSIDVYKNKLKPTRDFISFMAFVSFFPQLVAGPIERAVNLLPQFYKERYFSISDFSSGAKFMIVGFFMKLVVADRIAIYVDAVYNNVYQHEGLTFIVATILFAFQIYGDFAGYSLIAIGTARLFGFRLMTNFNRPYFAYSVNEFWKRWHISLSSWFRDYVYIPLGGSRVSVFRWGLNIFITFLLSGLWHGANWTFIIWGGINGIYLVIESLVYKRKKKTIFNVLITFILICFSWLFFRANNINEAEYILKTIFFSLGELYIPNGADVVTPVYILIVVGMLLVVELKREYFDGIIKLSNNNREIIRLTYYVMIVCVILYLGVFNSGQFIYFQF